MALSLLHSGERDAAYKMFQKAVDITPALARQFIAELRRMPGVQCIVAPYEADAQLAYLSQRDLVHAVITEDSDLIPFGCKRILYKMDGAGMGLEFRLRNIETNGDLKFNGWTHQMLQQMCIMAGCDYLKSIPGIGIKVRRTNEGCQPMIAIAGG
jgi:exonuclease-1